MYNFVDDPEYGAECYATLTQWYDLIKKFDHPVFAYEEKFRFVVDKRVNLFFKKKNEISYPLKIDVSFHLT